jgi:DNA-binding NtrC family response regulator
MIQNPMMAQSIPVFNPEMGNQNAIMPFNASASINTNNFTGNQQPMIINNKEQIQHHEDVEESLSIIDKEKELIIKALKKHRGKRRDASVDLGISERTLYRKLKEYDIEHL